jgi:hypothetical protein
MDRVVRSDGASDWSVQADEQRELVDIFGAGSGVFVRVFSGSDMRVVAAEPHGSGFAGRRVVLFGGAPRCIDWEPQLNGLRERIRRVPAS